MPCHDSAVYGPSEGARQELRGRRSSGDVCGEVTIDVRGGAMGVLELPPGM